MKTPLTILFCLLAIGGNADRRGQLMQQHPPTATPVFNPTNIVGLYGWYIPSNFVFASQSWIDISGLTNNIKVSGGGTNLIEVTNQLNSNSIVKWFDITAIINTNTVNHGGTYNGYTAATVVRRNTKTTFPNLYILNADFSDTHGALRTEISGTNCRFKLDGFTGLLETTNVWELVTIRIAGTFGELRTSTQIETGVVATVTGDTIQMQHEFGEVAELFMYRNMLSDTDIATVRTYLINKFALTANP
jgi:hypothetical protein